MRVGYFSYLTKRQGTSPCPQAKLAERRGGEGGRGGGTRFVHGRSRMTIDPRIPTMPGRSTWGFHHPGRHCLHQARSGRWGRGIIVLRMAVIRTSIGPLVSPCAMQGRSTSDFHRPEAYIACTHRESAFEGCQQVA